MKALARYQIILLGEQRHIGVNNLPKVVARECSGRESNPRSAHRESSALTTTTPSHWYQTNPVPDMHDTRTRNRQQKNGVDLWRRFLERVSWVLDVIPTAVQSDQSAQL